MKLLQNGYMYTRQKPLAQRAISSMVLRRQHCKARVKLIATNEFIEALNEHSHPPSDIRCEVAKVKAGIKCQTETTNDGRNRFLPLN